MGNFILNVFHRLVLTIDVTGKNHQFYSLRLARQCSKHSKLNIMAAVKFYVGCKLWRFNETDCSTRLIVIKTRIYDVYGSFMKSFYQKFTQRYFFLQLAFYESYHASGIYLKYHPEIFIFIKNLCNFNQHVFQFPQL